MKAAKIRSFFLSLIITLLLVEASCFLLLRYCLRYDLPTYSWGNVRSNFWVEVNPDFGAWHAANASYLQRRSCYQVEYHSNSFGMRDPERSLVSDKPRVVVLGDSFVEGYGVEEGKRITDLLEKATGVEYLNFGTAGSFGPTQYYLLYTTLAKKFSHSEVIVALFPQNDFSDDDYQVWKDGGHYRPFFVGSYPDYGLVYSGQKPKGDAPSLLRDLSGVLREFTNTYNVAAWAYAMYRFGMKEIRSQPNGDAYAAYYDFSEEHWQRLRFVLEKIVAAAAGKKVTVVLIPSLQDLGRFDRDRGAPLTKKLEELGKERGFAVVDLLPALHDASPNWKDFYHLPCDRHLNEAGDAVAAQAILSQRASVAGTH